jgi:hypothetical protein
MKKVEPTIDTRQPNESCFIEQTMSRPLQLQQAQGWYSTGSVKFADTDAVLADVFAEAKQIFGGTLCETEDDKKWMTEQASIKDVVKAVADAQDAYQARRTSKAWKWLTQFSSRVTYYSSILDVMVQHHPEYASLAWGAMKLLFVVSNSLPLLNFSFSADTARVLQTMRSQYISL